MIPKACGAETQQGEPAEQNVSKFSSLLFSCSSACNHQTPIFNNHLCNGEDVPVEESIRGAGLPASSMLSAERWPVRGTRCAKLAQLERACFAHHNQEAPDGHRDKQSGLKEDIASNMENVSPEQLEKGYINVVGILLSVQLDG